MATDSTPDALAEALVGLMRNLHEGQSLDLDIGATSVAAFDEQADAYVRQFAPKTFEANICNLVRARCWADES